MVSLHEAVSFEDQTSALQEALHGGDVWRAVKDAATGRSAKRLRGASAEAAAAAAGAAAGAARDAAAGAAASLVPGRGFALAARLALQPKRADPMALGAFGRAPLVRETI
jgi:hypothetical protein